MKQVFEKIKRCIRLIKWFNQLEESGKIYRIQPLRVRNMYGQVELSPRLINDKKYNNFREVANIIMCDSKDASNCLTFEIEGILYTFYRDPRY